MCVCVNGHDIDGLNVRGKTTNLGDEVIRGAGGIRRIPEAWILELHSSEAISHLIN